ncbi:vacuolar fusion protein MON1 homolog A-like [Limulus polyphemus]|uniref:Vacuolar fusion protein MON1 homolog n=1 Tax=Limulus polyphemus TaxID=6850 RepID=A0ABM1BFJ3_LIMPO|nr:vacuolar fusion protein MON1 homolog A-like [Limulus polyphemus]
MATASCKSLEDSETARESEEETEIPKDFEPGASSESILISIDLYEEVENSPGSVYEDVSYRRRKSTICELERSAGKRVLAEEQVETSKSFDDKSQDGQLKAEIGHDESIRIKNSPNVEPIRIEMESIQMSSDEEKHEIIETAEDIHNPEWKQHSKHIFILSEAGKPIYSRFGSEDKLVTLMGVMQALVSIVQDNGDVIRSIHAGDHKFVFLVRLPLILVAVANTNASAPQLVVQLNCVYNLILSVLTSTQLCSIFEQRRNYDLRRLLGGAEKFLDNLVDTMDSDPSFLLVAVRCLPLTSAIRDTISQSIVQYCSKVKNVVFAILVAKNQLVTIVRMKKYSLHPSDLHLVMNLVNSSDSFKAAESWTPICLPKFDSSGFLHAHVSYLDDNCPACLLLLTVDKNLFFTLQECRRKIVERLHRYNCLEAINASLESEGYSVSEVGLPDLRHFIYKSKSAAQFTEPRLEAPYVSNEDQSNLFGLYQYLHHRMYNSARPLKILFYVGQKEIMLSWHMAGFELYAAFEPMVTKFTAVNTMNKLVRWIKKEEDRLFIMNAPTI